jgi:hypothetical protein
VPSWRGVVPFVAAALIAGLFVGGAAMFSMQSRTRPALATLAKVKKVSLNGGAAITLCDARVPVHAWWRSDVIYFD